MPTFTWTVSYGASADRQPRTKTAKFGDGYEQRAVDGINTNPEKWNLNFTNRDYAEIDAIEAFLNTAAGATSFTWTPPRSVTAGNYICRSWQRQVVVGGVDSLSCTFEEVFGV